MLAERTLGALIKYMTLAPKTRKMIQAESFFPSDTSIPWDQIVHTARPTNRTAKRGFKDHSTYTTHPRITKASRPIRYFIVLV